MVTEVTYLYNAVVTSIYDGDTIRVNIDLGFNFWKMNETIRLSGIDAPELRGIERPLGLKSKEWLEKKIPIGSKIIIQTEKDKQEKYGRYLGTIWADGVNINLQMMEEKFAIPYE